MNHATRKLPTLQQIRREHNITSRAVAEEAGVDFRTEYLLEIGAAVERDDALKILSALSTLTGERCAIDTVSGLCIVTAPTVKKRHTDAHSDQKS
jgi:transcriptional regulator with XRE-family HTH domain